MRYRAKKNCGDTRERVAWREDEFALRNVIAEPATKVRRAGVEDVVKCVETDGQAGSARESVTRRQHPGSIKNQQRMRKIACAENANAQEQAPKGKDRKSVV